jgi:hypothetical protein
MAGPIAQAREMAKCAFAAAREDTATGLEGWLNGLNMIVGRTPDFCGSHNFFDGHMVELIAQFRPIQEYIVLDLPPLLGVADARFLSIQADMTVLVVR